MKNYYLVALSMVAIALGLAPAAQAVDSPTTLDFSLASDKSNAAQASSSDLTVEADHAPLDIPDKATTAPLGSESKPDGIAKLPPPPPPDESAIATSEPSSTVSALPFAPPVAPVSVSNANVSPVSPAAVPPAEHAPVQASPQQERSQPVAAAPSPPPSPQVASTSTAPADGLNFEPEPPPVAPSLSAVATKPSVTPAATGLSASLHTFPELDALFRGDSNSLVARAVGSAEGTRTPNGGKTYAYQGHVDPGNGVWNLGTFSYQHGANSPEEADKRQIRRLRRQAATLRQAAAEKGIALTLEEELNGIDLANQSPQAALSRGGYIDRLAQARDMGLQGSDAVLWARTRSFLDPDTSQWNAPGLGNTVDSITNDQERRLRAIARAIKAQPDRAIAAASNSDSDPSNPSYSHQASSSRAEMNADLIISLDLPPV